MRFFVLLGLLLAGQSEPQFPPIGIIDFYGLRTVPEEDARRALPLKVGDTVDTSETSFNHLRERELSAVWNQCLM